jgi:hypothetical protein
LKHLLLQSPDFQYAQDIQNHVQTRYQLTSHLQSNTLELDDKAQTLSYEHYYPYGGTAIIPILSRVSRLPLASKSLVDCWVSVPRLLFGLFTYGNCLELFWVSLHFVNGKPVNCYGCQTALLKVIEDWKKALDQNKYVAAILMDPYCHPRSYKDHYFS